MEWTNFELLCSSFCPRFHPELILLDTSLICIYTYICQTQRSLALFGAVLLRDLLDNCWTPHHVQEFWHNPAFQRRHSFSQKDFSGSTNFVYTIKLWWFLSQKKTDRGGWKLISCICNSNIDTSVSKKISRERESKDISYQRD